MNIFHRVTLQSLKKNKTRTIVTIIGIILSTALICAVTTSVASFIDYAREYVIRTTGGWHGAMKNADSDKTDNITECDEVDGYAVIQEKGYAKLENSANEYKTYLYIASLERTDSDILPIDIIEGKYPENENEILIPQHLKSNGKTEYNTGDVIELEIGDRLRDGIKLNQYDKMFAESWENGEYTSLVLDEDFIPRVTRKYTVCGIYKRPEFEPYTAPGYTAIVIPDGEIVENSVSDIYYSLKNPKKIYDFIGKIQINQLEESTNYALLMFSGVSEYDGFYGVLYGLMSVLIILIMFGSFSLIYNAFSISVSERTRQFGILSSVGATRKQLRQTVFYEALSLSAIGIPSGIIVGLIGIGITLMFIGNKISSIVVDIDIPMRMSISLWAILTACAVELITVIISAWIPAIRATRITAVEAIRQNKDIKSKNKPIKTPKIVYRVFGLSGVLAQKYFKRSRKKYRSTIMSLFMSIVLFISASAFSEYIIRSVDAPFGTQIKYDLNYMCFDMKNSEITADELLDIFKSEENITNAVYTAELGVRADISENFMSSEAVRICQTRDREEVYVNLVFLDDEAYRQLLKDNNLDENKFMNTENPVCVAIDIETFFDYDKGKYINTKLLSGDRCEALCKKNINNIDGYVFSGYCQDENEKEERLIYRNPDNWNDDDVKIFTRDEATVEFLVKSEKTITEKPFWWWYPQDFRFTFVYPCCMIDSVLPYGKDELNVEYYMTSDNHRESFNNLTEMLENNNIISQYRLGDVAGEHEKERNIVTIITVFAYGFIVLISLISSANVFNTISTNVILRRRDFAMLKSTGMTDREFRKMLNYECIMYGTKSLLFGLPVSALTTYLIYLAVNEGVESEFIIPWKAVGTAILSVFAVVFVTMLYSAEKIKDDNLIETLKNENL